jgi:flagellar export protein FliJ
MPKFTFRLESVLRVRLHAEQQEQRAVADAQRKLFRLQTQLEEMQAGIETSSVELRKHIGSGQLDARWLLQHAHHAQDLRARAAALSDEIFHAGLALTTAQERLVVASAQRKSLQKLRERQLEQFATLEQKRERNVHDEIAARSGHRP